MTQNLFAPILDAVMVQYWAFSDEDFEKILYSTAELEMDRLQGRFV